MRNQHRDTVVLRKILSETDMAEALLGDAGIEDFLADELLKRAVSMTVINIGELVKGLSDEFRAEHSEIPWKAIAGMRDIAAHKYLTLRMEDVYNTVKIDIPQLREAIKRIPLTD